MAKLSDADIDRIRKLLEVIPGADVRKLDGHGYAAVYFPWKDHPSDTLTHIGQADVLCPQIDKCLEEEGYEATNKMCVGAKYLSISFYVRRKGA